MKIAVVIDTWFPFMGGGQITALEISKRLSKKGIKVDIITRECGNYKSERIRNLKIIKLGKKSAPENNFAKVSFLIESFFYILTRDYNLVHGHAFLPGFTLFLLKIIKNIPVIYHVHGTSIGTNLKGLILLLLEKILLTKIPYSAQITVSRDFLLIPNVNKKVFYVPNGINVKPFDLIKVKKFKVKTLLFVGRLHAQKNIYSLIYSFSSLVKMNSTLRLLIVGDGPERSGIARLIKSLNLEKKIIIKGTLYGNDLIKVYKSSHIFILPSIYEGFPLSLLEAWSAKLPVIVSETGDCKYLVINKVNGFLIKNPNKESIIASINKALKSKNLQDLGENGYELTKANYSWEKSTNRTLDIYKSLL